MKATGTYKMSKEAKCILTFMSKGQRKNDFKRLMVQAELEYEWNKKYGSKREKISNTDD